MIVSEFWDQMLMFAKIAFPYVLIATVTAYFTRIYAFKWREAMTFSYVDEWQTVEEEVEGSSQRIQEDIYRFARIFESLGLQVIRAIMTLMAFLPILWGLSKESILNILRIFPAVWFGLLSWSRWVDWLFPGLSG